jgi:hypothetical protein
VAAVGGFQARELEAERARLQEEVQAEARAAMAVAGELVRPKRLLDESPWLQFTVECRRR